jgi:Chaperone of endosialidase
MKKIILFFITFLLFQLSFAQPANDEPCTATNLTVLVSADPCIPPIVSTSGATYTNLVFPTGSCIGANHLDVWYKFISLSDITFLYFTFSNISNIEYEVFSASACNGTFTRVYCNNYTGHEVSEAIPNLIVGNTYYVRISNIFNAGIPLGVCAYTGFPSFTAKVGINTNNPYNNLDVAGNVSLRNKVGIGESNPQFPLTFTSNVGDKISFYGNVANASHYGFGIQGALLQMHTDVAAANIAFGYGSSNSFTERARIINQGEIGMLLSGRLQLKTGSQSAGLWLSNAANSATPAFIGIAAENQVGFYGANGAAWGLSMNTTTGNVGIGINGVAAAKPLSFPATLGEKILLYPGGVGEVGIGVYGNELRLHADNPGAKVSFGTQDNAGVYSENALAQRNGVYAFSVLGSLWVNGTTYASDERFKQNITPITSALQKLIQINGVEYEMKTKEFSKNHFSAGRQIGLLAQNVETVVPEAVNEKDGYKGVDYARLVPLLIEAVKEQNKKIELQQIEIDNLKRIIQSR